MSITEITDKVQRTFGESTETVGCSTEMAHQLHKGRAYFAGVKFLLAGSGTYWCTFTTDSKIVHFQDREVTAYDSAGATVEVDIELYEGVTVGVEGDVVPIYNADRRISTPSTTILRQGDTISAEGTELPKCNILRADKKFLSKEASDIEYIMKGETVYGLKVINKLASTVNIKFGWNWSEL